MLNQINHILFKYRFMNLRYYVSYHTEICDDDGIVITKEPTDISIISP